ncbi:hypothetical protein GCM10009849_32750 [Sinomonas flava]|uniref:Uncharacterized protein n=1 Tax=Sinomonas flava TaxID=496857 RepID=A0ABN3C0S8_9MICC
MVAPGDDGELTPAPYGSAGPGRIVRRGGTRGRGEDSFPRDVLPGEDQGHPTIRGGIAGG